MPMSNFIVNSIKGIIQLALVIAFVVGAFAASALLKSGKPEVKESTRPDREFFVETENIKKQAIENNILKAIFALINFNELKLHFLKINFTT